MNSEQGRGAQAGIQAAFPPAEARPPAQAIKPKEDILEMGWWQIRSPGLRLKTSKLEAAG